MKTKRPFDLKRFIIATLRKASYRYGERYKALKLAKDFYGLYKCASCKKKFERKAIQVDHINPIVPISAWVFNWDDYIERMFCSADNLQVLCKPCHKQKTQKENKIRKKANEKI